MKKYFFLTILVMGMIPSGFTYGYEMHWMRSSHSEESLKQMFHEAMSSLTPLKPIQSMTHQKLVGPEPEPLSDEMSRYIDAVILNAEDVEISGDNGQLNVSFRFPRSGMHIPVANRDEVDFWKVYALDLSQRVSFKMFYLQDIFYISELRGIFLQVKMPVISDEVILKQMSFDVANSIASVRIKLRDLFELVGRVRVTMRQIGGIDWNIPGLGSIPDILRDIHF